MTEPEHEHEWGPWGGVYHDGHSKWRGCMFCDAVESKGVCSCPECNPDPADIPPLPRSEGLPMAVVYTAGVREYEMYLPPGAAAVLTKGGILVQHEAGTIARIVSFRPLFPGEVPHAAEAEAQHQDG